MTNNINGIDVSECPLFDKKTGCYHTFDGECVKDSCALYKWLLDYKRLQEENEKLKANKRKCAFKSLDNTFCDEAKIKIDQLELDKDCLNASLETARKYRGIAEIDRDKYKQALENIKLYINQECKNKQCPQTQQYWYFPNYVGDYPPINTNDNVKVTYSNHTEALNDRN